jgi:hypothetical protein
MTESPEKSVRRRCQRHAVALAPDGSCVLCRRLEGHSVATRPLGVIAGVLILASSLVLAAVVLRSRGHGHDGQPEILPASDKSSSPGRATLASAMTNAPLSAHLLRPPKPASLSSPSAEGTVPPQRPTNDEITAALEARGFRPDDAGRFTTWGPFGFDPNTRRPESPRSTFTVCMKRILSCIHYNRDVDACFSEATRCRTATPWKGDPAGFGCCPGACLDLYTNDRQSTTPAIALDSVVRSSKCADAVANGQDPKTEIPEHVKTACLQHIMKCASNNQDFDGCSARADRCPTPTPWVDNPNIDCCPGQCLDAYASKRPAVTPAVALQSTFGSNCD